MKILSGVDIFLKLSYKFDLIINGWTSEFKACMKRLIYILCFCASIFSSSANALEITYSYLNPFSGEVSKAEALLLRGEIVPGDYEYLLDVIRSDQERFWRSTGFVLASPGGDIQEALKIAHLIKGTYSTVWVGNAGGPCVSACFFMFISAVRREAGNKTIGIHRPYIHPRRMISMSPREAETLQEKVLREARLYLENQDVPTNLIDKMFQFSSMEVYWLSNDEITEQLGRRSPWYEQFLIAKCGFNKSIERQYFLNNDQAILDQLMEVNNCGAQLLIPEAKVFIESELKNFIKK